MKLQATVVITTKNNENIIRECLDSVYSQTIKNIAVVVADDGSTDKTHDIIKKCYPKTLLIVNPKSEGPSKNRNLALTKVATKYVVFMDSDAVIEEDWIEKALDFMGKHPKAGALGGKIFNADGSLQATTAFFHITGACGFNAKKDINLKEYLWWPSSTIMMRTDVVKKVECFDETFHYPMEDVDLCLKINLTGYKVLYYDKLHSTHKESATVKKALQKKRVTYMKKRNKMIMLLGNLETETLLKYGAVIFGFWLLELLTLPYKKELLLGNLAGTLKIKHLFRKRAAMKKFRKVRDNELKNIVDYSVLKILTYGTPNK